MCIGFLFLGVPIICGFITEPSADLRIEVQQLEIHSSWQGWGSERTNVVIRHAADGRYLSDGELIPERLVSELIVAMRHPAIPAANLDNLGMTSVWLGANNASALREVPGSRSLGRAETQEFMRTFRDLVRMRKIVAEIFCDWHTDDYPSVTVAVTMRDGSKLTVSSNSQRIFMLPWVQDGAQATYNADISRAISALLPAKATNRNRLAGEDLAAELAEQLLWDIGNPRRRLGCAN